MFGREVREAFKVIVAYYELKGSQIEKPGLQCRKEVAHAELRLPPFCTGTHFPSLILALPVPPCVARWFVCARRPLHARYERGIFTNVLRYTTGRRLRAALLLSRDLRQLKRRTNHGQGPPTQPCQPAKSVQQGQRPSRPAET